MKESRVFELNQVTAEQVLEAVTTFLRGEKSMEVQSVATPNGYLIQAAQADTLRTLSGMKLATTVERHAAQCDARRGPVGGQAGRGRRGDFSAVAAGGNGGHRCV